MAAAASIARLRAIAARLIEREDVDAAWFGACLSEYEVGAAHGLALGDAFGFRLEPGERGWWEADARERRDELIRAIARQYFSGLSDRRAARDLSQALSRYETGAWRQHRAYATAPEALARTLRGELFRLLRIGAPCSFDVIRRALRGAPDASIRAPDVPAGSSHEHRDSDDHETATGTAA